MSRALLKDLKANQTVTNSFKCIWNNFYRYAMENPVRFAFTEQFANSPLVERCRAESMSFFAPLFELFERGKGEKVFKDISLEIFIAFTFSPLTRLIKEHLSGEIVLDEKALDTTFEIAWDAVTK
jgi:hypothetical protein